MRIKLDWNTISELFNAKISNLEDTKDLSNIKFVIEYFERDKKFDALKNITKILNQYIKLETYSNGSVADLSNLPDNVRVKIAECRERIKTIDTYINQEFVFLEETLIQ